MRVLATGMEWFSENPGGLPRYFADYLAAWREQGGAIQALVRTLQQGCQDQRPSYVKSIYSTSTNPFRVRREWEQTLQSELKGHRFDVFNPHFAYYAWGWTKMKTDIPVVTHFHGPWAYEAKLESGHKSRFRTELQFQLQRNIEQRVYKFSDRFIVLSHSFKEQLATHYGVPHHRIHVIPGAADVDKFHDADDQEAVRCRLGLPKNRVVLLSVRRLARRMGLENLIHSINLLRVDFPNIYLVVVGGGELYSELTRLVEELGLQAHVQLTNRVPEDLLPLYYQAADLTVVPSLALEGFGLVTVESMACGTPVLGTPLGGTKEILERFDSNLLFQGASPEHLVGGLRRLLGRIGQLPSRVKTRQYVLDNYTWGAIVPQINEVFAAAQGQ